MEGHRDTSSSLQQVEFAAFRPSLTDRQALCGQQAERCPPWPILRAQPFPSVTK